MSIYLAILYSILYAFFNVFSLVWIEIRGKSLKDFGLTCESAASAYPHSICALPVLEVV